MADSRDLGVATRRRFGTFEVDLATGELRRNGVKRKIQEQPVSVLAMLLDHPGEVVTREALRERLWPADTFVDFEHGLNTAIRKLRRALDEAAENPRYVETLARRGYRFIAPVTVEASEVTGTPEPVPGQPQPAKRCHGRRSSALSSRSRSRQSSSGPAGRRAMTLQPRPRRWTAPRNSRCCPCAC